MQPAAGDAPRRARPHPLPGGAELEAQILADDRRCSGQSRRATAVGATLARREPTQLIGRADDIAAVRAMLASRPIVTICGPGGVGKARGWRWPLPPPAPSTSPRSPSSSSPPLRDPEATVPLVATAFDVEQRQGLTLERTIEEFVQDRPVLLLLDNCEHVLDTVVPLVQRLCRHACA